MSISFQDIDTLQELWQWVTDHRKGAWRFPEKWGVKGYRGDAAIALVGEVPGDRSLDYLERGLTYPDDSFCSDIFDCPQDKRLYELLAKYGLHTAHLMDASVSCLSPPEDDPDQDERIFLKQIDIIKAQAVLVMNKSEATRKDDRRLRLQTTVEGYLKGRKSPQIYPIYHYRWTIGSRFDWEGTLRSVLKDVVQNHPSLSTLIRFP